MQKYTPVPNLVIDGDEFTSGFLGLDWSPSAESANQKRTYENSVLSGLNRLMGRRTGWAVLNEIYYQKSRTMVIKPYHPTKTDPFNAFAQAKDGKASTMKGTQVGGGQGGGNATKNSTNITGFGGFYQGFRIKITGTRAGAPYTAVYKFRCNSDTQITLTASYSEMIGDNPSQAPWDGDTGPISWIIEGSPTAAPEIGTGTGSDTEIRFSPSTFTVRGAPTGPGAASDEILLHEMIHGLRQMNGRAVFELVLGNPGMDNYEEFAAIVVSNVYRSELGIPQLRSDHHGFAPLTGPNTAAASFKTTYQSYLANMEIEQPRFCTHLRTVTCAFNPFL